jgi:carbon storage regulator
MLVLSRKANESIQIGPHIRIDIVRIGPVTVKIGITAPDNVAIVRTELIEERGNDAPYDNA